MAKLPLDTWKDIFRNVRDAQLEQSKEDGIEALIEEGTVERVDVEVLWLDSSDEWVLCSGTELFEDGFKSEKEAQDRLNYLEKEVLKSDTD